MKRRPPALVEMFPPMWQLPFAPKSSGIINLKQIKANQVSGMDIKNWCSKKIAQIVNSFGQKMDITNLVNSFCMHEPQ